MAVIVVALFLRSKALATAGVGLVVLGLLVSLRIYAAEIKARNQWIGLTRMALAVLLAIWLVAAVLNSAARDSVFVVGLVYAAGQLVSTYVLYLSERKA